MNALARVFVFKIAATVLFWCVPLILLPASWLEAAGFPPQSSYMFVRMLGWAYLALCVGYAFGLAAALKGARLMGPIWVGIVSNAGACLYLLYYGLTGRNRTAGPAGPTSRRRSARPIPMAGSWTGWGLAIQALAWGSALATAAITLGLYRFGVRGDRRPAG